MTSRLRQLFTQLPDLYRRYAVWLTPVAIGLALLFVTALVWQNRVAFLTFQWRLNPASLALSFVCCVLTWLLFGLNWGLVTRRLGSSLPLRDSMRIYFISTVSQFLPGRVWYLATRVYLYDREGVRKTITSVALVLETAIVVLSGVLVYTVVRLIMPATAVEQQAVRWLLIPLIPLVGIFSYPTVLLKALNALAARLGKVGLTTQLSYRDTLTWLAFYSLNWLIGGLVLFYLLDGIGGLPLSAFLTVLAGFCLSSVISQLLFFVPGGLGVREFALGYLLTTVAPLPLAVIGVIAFRIWLILGEVVCLILLARPVHR